MKKNNYSVIVDANNPQAAIADILARTKDAITAEFKAGVNSDGSVPRGLLAGIAKKYGYTQAGVSRILNCNGISTKKMCINFN